MLLSMGLQRAGLADNWLTELSSLPHVHMAFSVSVSKSLFFYTEVIIEFSAHPKSRMISS